MDRRLSMLIFAVVIVLFAASCGSGRADMDVTLSPANGTIDQALDVPITAVFGSDVTEPANWTNAFFVKKDNAGDTICTLVTYTSSNKTAVCAHDPLEASTSYTATLTGVIAVNGEISTWTTSAPVAQTV
ncbi:MAG: Ig-like domain-containing protein, partial [bacterium]